MNTLITFGKYNGQTYDYIIKNDIKYCNYIISQNGKSKSFINFQQFLKENTQIFKNKYDIKHLKNICKINCSDLPENQKKYKQSLYFF